MDEQLSNGTQKLDYWDSLLPATKGCLINAEITFSHLELKIKAKKSLLDDVITMALLSQAIHQYVRALEIELEENFPDEMRDDNYVLAYFKDLLDKDDRNIIEERLNNATAIINRRTELIIWLESTPGSGGILDCRNRANHYKEVNFEDVICTRERIIGNDNGFLRLLCPLKIK